MPPQIGDIISSTVYDSKLKSWVDHPVKSSTLACYFIDVAGGNEFKTPSKSWKVGQPSSLPQYLLAHFLLRMWLRKMLSSSWLSIFRMKARNTRLYLHMKPRQLSLNKK